MNITVEKLEELAETLCELQEIVQELKEALLSTDTLQTEIHISLNTLSKMWNGE